MSAPLALFAFCLSAAAGLAQAAEPAAAAAGPSVEDLVKLRDPFKRPSIVSDSGVPKSELEQFPVEQFRMVGVTTGPDRLRAMIVAPNGKTYFVAEKARIGVRNGFIRRISTEGIVVREKFTNLLGQEENIDFELKLPPERKNALAGQTGG